MLLKEFKFEKTFDFVNSHLLKGVATMTELTKTDNRQTIGKIKPTDKMVMMPSRFDGTKAHSVDKEEGSGTGVFQCVRDSWRCLNFLT